MDAAPRISVAGAGLIGARHIEEIEASPDADLASIKGIGGALHAEGAKRASRVTVHAVSHDPAPNVSAVRRIRGSTP